MKRFTETNKWRDTWFRKLSLKAKALFIWLTDNCDNAGVVDPDLESASFDIGETVKEQHFAELNSRLKRLPNGKFWLTKFIRFQYGNLSANCIPHLRVIELLRSHGINYPEDASVSTTLVPTLETTLVNGVVPTPKEEDREKDKEEDRDRDGKRATLEEVKLCCQKTGLPESDAVYFWNKCEGNGWTNAGKPIKSWPHVIAAWKVAGYMPSQKKDAPKSDAVGGRF